MPKPRRSHLEIIGDILRACPTSTMRLLLRAGLSYPMFQRYLKSLREAELLEGPIRDGTRNVYKVTPKGEEFIFHLDKALKKLNGYFEVNGDS